VGDDWRVCILSGDLPGQLTADEVYPRLYPASAQEAAELESFRQALISALGSRLGDQVQVSLSSTEIFLYAPSAGSADEAAQVAREVLARRDVSALVRTERWSPWEEEWLDVTDKPSADVAAEQQAEQQAEHEYRQEQERERSRRAGFPAWQVRVEVPSHRDVVALAGHLAAQGWRVRRRRRHLLVGADCEDDAKGLVRELSGDGRADADTAFRVGRVSYSYMLFDAYSTQVTGGGGPLVRNFSSTSQQTRRSSRRTIGYAPCFRTWHATLFGRNYP
jgi:hypothetical protein